MLISLLRQDPNKRLKRGFAAISEMCSSLRLSSTVKDRACEIFTEAEKVLRERKIHESGAACIYTACRIERCPRTFKEMTAVARDTNMVIIMRCFKTITKKLNLPQIVLDTIKASDYLERFCSSLNMSKEGTKVAKHLGEIVSDRDKQHLWDGKSPISMAAAILLLITQLSDDDSHLTLQQVSSHTGASSAAIRSAIVPLHAAARAHNIVPEWFLSKEQVAAKLNNATIRG